MRNLWVIFIFTFSILHYLCRAQEFYGPILQGKIENDLITEASGIAASLRNPGILYLHNDSGDQARIFAIDTHGRHRGTIFLENGENRDWEDIAVGKVPNCDTSFIFIADIGDNEGKYHNKFIYRIPEPDFPSADSASDTTIADYERITFQLQDGPRDAETLMFDNLTGDIFIVSKREEHVRVYRLAYPQDTSGINIAEFVTELPMSYVVGGDISHDGQEILLKTYTNVFYWKRSLDKPLYESFSIPADTLPYDPEPQGEAICWAVTDSGYFTVSEEPANLPAYLYFYRRVSKTGIDKRHSSAKTFYLGQNYPNPFNDQTKILLFLQESAQVELCIINSNGELVSNIFRGKLNPGRFAFHWNGKNQSGIDVCSGNYICKAVINNHVYNTKLILLR